MRSLNAFGKREVSRKSFGRFEQTYNVTDRQISSMSYIYEVKMQYIFEFVFFRPRCPGVKEGRLGFIMRRDWVRIFRGCSAVDRVIPRGKKARIANGA